MGDIWVYEVLSVVMPVVGMIILVIVYGGYHNEIATAFSKPRNDDVVGIVIARSKTTKQSINHWYLFIHKKNKKIHYHSPPSSLWAEWNNPQTTILLFINRKIKEFTTLCHICHCEGQRPVAIHKPQNHHKKTEKKKKSLIIDLYYFYFITK